LTMVMDVAAIIVAEFFVAAPLQSCSTLKASSLVHKG